MKIKGLMPYIWNKSVPIFMPTSRLGTQWPSLGTKCTIVGWGCTQRGGDEVSTALVVELEVASDQFCYTVYRVDLKYEFCAGYHNLSKGICSGDSGGGLICERHGMKTIAGVSSGAHTWEPESFPSIFARVPPVIDWIRTQTAQD
ncbi:hypothetical protein EG68_02582 [Paragonimus skrjabini miyazakii]|uniref:Peptidase S1 domain-containing protein n=1 Tax=Paragonimus skrjabini miyazakii TaxID=59628 RepID=A0A8S9Z374_9TREM|nr:hypothetical protein EG68_02582 [Paragonimus skrjabini miyazakii]